MSFKRDWWKLLGVILIIYSLIFGMLVPLGPGIVRVHPVRTIAGSTLEMNVEGYNSHYDESEVSAWLKLDERFALEASRVDVIDRRHLTAIFEIPVAFPRPDSIHVLSLILYNEIDGHSILPQAIFAKSDPAVPSGAQAWQDKVIQVDKAVTFHFPFRNILLETIRNTFFHVQLWMSMMAIFTISMLHSIRYLRNRSILADHKAQSFASVGVLYGMLGITTGMIWAKNSWGAYWSFDVKQNMAAIAMLIYFAYFILRSSMTDKDLGRRFSAVYNIFAFLMLIPLLYIIPRMTASLHPGSGGNPAFGSQDLDNTMRMVFYPAIVGWILFGSWIANVQWRSLRLKHESEEA
ncbi:MAG: cytochrome c biogenesis protein CcsA [Saprospiraceae bacterium]|nr:cytochrome c biogenesis protein CcsA [Saprospiraceae bacterium]